MVLLEILLQSEPASLAHQHLIIALLIIGMSIISILIFLRITWLLKKKTAEMKAMQLQQHVAKIDLIRKDHSDTLEKIRVEMLKREEERTRQWMESEKETLHVLNGVSTLLDLTDKLSKSESEKIMQKLIEIQGKIEKLTSKD